jgi:hypothetical protein
MRFAKELVASVRCRRARSCVARRQDGRRVRAEEEKKLVAALATIGVDWSAPPRRRRREPRGLARRRRRAARQGGDASA